MIFHTRKELEFKISLLHPAESLAKQMKPPVCEPSTTYVASNANLASAPIPITKPTTPLYSQKKMSWIQEQSQQLAIETDKQKAADEVADEAAARADLLDPEKYPEHPDLQQEIWDHLTLKALRAKYLHISHECSFGGNLGIKKFDPFKESIRTKPFRNVTHS